MLLRPLKGLIRHLLLDRIFVFAPAVFPVIRDGLVIIPLNALDGMLAQKIHDLVHKRGISAEVAEMIHLIRLQELDNGIGGSERLDIAVYVSEYSDFHCVRLLSSDSPDLVFCLVHDPADIAQASPPERMIGPAVAPAFFLLVRDSFQNGRDALVGQHILDNVLIGIAKTVAYLIRHHRHLASGGFCYNPAFFNTGVISS